ncbi:Os03g0250200 [Oryza sativa Japonica Group]|uniref:HVA22-like protein n=2 Tax=Oryza sativa subsp. japonica TaxID=39947 RepID=Q0DTF8_ORYSJ|nr:hypothetical protein EE612_016516 [Oryza sativa]BAF11480.1 Os03g0250200 [Oryza sativa Japonica Group]BAS83284.1 Os03g0250200 [Oryza sativa Japonica Group]|eukprot:NP_001049566.1 Os03g0250200 [Oryza sativa Japonica Group]
MMGGFLSRVLLLAFGYAYPAYECYKTVELNKPEIEQLIFWCQYWILVALMTVMERFGDFTISWLPFYSEAKLMFFIYLWYPKTKGTTYIYGTFFRPYISQHENEIDRNLLELRARATDVVVLYFQKAATVGQNTFFDVLKYVASQSPSQRSSQQPSQVLTCFSSSKLFTEQTHLLLTTGITEFTISVQSLMLKFSGALLKQFYPCCLASLLAICFFFMQDAFTITAVLPSHVDLVSAATFSINYRNRNNL